MPASGHTDAYLAGVKRKLEGLLKNNPNGPRAAIYKKGLATTAKQQAQNKRGN